MTAVFNSEFLEAFMLIVLPVDLRLYSHITIDLSVLDLYDDDGMIPSLSDSDIYNDTPNSSSDIDKEK